MQKISSDVQFDSLVVFYSNLFNSNLLWAMFKLSIGQEIVFVISCARSLMNFAIKNVLDGNLCFTRLLMFDSHELDSKIIE